MLCKNLITTYMAFSINLWNCGLASLCFSYFALFGYLYLTLNWQAGYSPIAGESSAGIQCFHTSLLSWAVKWKESVLQQFTSDMVFYTVARWGKLEQPVTYVDGIVKQVLMVRDAEFALLCPSSLMRWVSLKEWNKAHICSQMMWILLTIKLHPDMQGCAVCGAAYLCGTTNRTLRMLKRVPDCMGPKLVTGISQ